MKTSPVPPVLPIDPSARETDPPGHSAVALARALVASRVDAQIAAMREPPRASTPPARFDARAFAFAVADQNGTPTHVTPAGAAIAQLAAQRVAPRELALRAAPPTIGAAQQTPQLALGLEATIEHSGLFYESHLAQWVAGTRSIDALRAEPQASVMPQASAVPQTSVAPQAGVVPQANVALQAGVVPAGRDALAAPDALAAHIALAGPAAHGASSSDLGIAPALAPIVSQQLDALATHAFAFVLRLPDGRAAQLAVEDEHRASTRDDDTAPRWRTRLSIELPRLGAIDADLVLHGHQLGVRVHARDAAACEALRAACAELIDALDAARLPHAVVRVEPTPESAR